MAIKQIDLKVTSSDLISLDLFNMITWYNYVSGVTYRLVLEVNC